MSITDTQAHTSLPYIQKNHHDTAVDGRTQIITMTAYNTTPTTVIAITETAATMVVPPSMVLPTMSPPKNMQPDAAYDGTTFDGAAFNGAAFDRVAFNAAAFGGATDDGAARWKGQADGVPLSGRPCPRV